MKELKQELKELLKKIALKEGLGFVGVGIGNKGFNVYVKTEKDKGLVPTSFKGYPITIIVGEIFIQ